MDAKCDGAVFSELVGVAEEVEQHLAQLARVGGDDPEVRVLLADQAKQAVTRLEHGGNRLIHERDTDLGVITTDPVKLRQVLINLLGNADKFTEDGTITLRTKAVETTPDSVLVRFEVQDTGIGINPAQLATVFDPFVQADPSSTRRYGGVGLGLTICKRLCEQLGGSLTAASEPDVGSTFTVTLPVHLGPSG